MKTLDNFKALLIAVLPPQQSVLLSSVTGLLRQKDPNFSPRDYGEDKLLPLIKKCSDIIRVEQHDEYFPPVHKCVLFNPIHDSQHALIANVPEGKSGTSSYESLFRRYATQPKKSAFAFFPYREDLGETWDSPFRRLARLAASEDWSSSANIAYPDNVDVLKNYLNFTFLRLLTEGKIEFSDSKAWFNTGLQTELGVDVVALFDANSRSDCEDWFFVGFFEWGNRVLDGLRKPQVAQYITDPVDVVFNWKYALVPNVPHIIEDNKERLPVGIQDNPILAKRLIDGAIQDLVERVKRNYKLAVPHWYHGRIQLLLPLFLTDSVHADLALVAERDDKRKSYNVRTALSMDDAYNDARLICRPDSTWIHP